MFKAMKKTKNFICCNELILKGMMKRRRLASAAILNICDTRERIRLVK